jgi:hypothetical protein
MIPTLQCVVIAWGKFSFPAPSNHQLDPCAELRCHELNDQFGVHCLQYASNRHNDTAKLLFNYFRRAGLAGAQALNLV